MHKTRDEPANKCKRILGVSGYAVWGMQQDAYASACFREGFMHQVSHMWKLVSPRLLATLGGVLDVGCPHEGLFLQVPVEGDRKLIVRDWKERQRTIGNTCSFCSTTHSRTIGLVLSYSKNSFIFAGSSEGSVNRMAFTFIASASLTKSGFLFTVCEYRAS